MENSNSSSEEISWRKTEEKNTPITTHTRVTVQRNARGKDRGKSRDFTQPLGCTYTAMSSRYTLVLSVWVAPQGKKDIENSLVVASVIINTHRLQFLLLCTPLHWSAFEERQSYTRGVRTPEMGTISSLHLSRYCDRTRTARPGTTEGYVCVNY